MSINLTPIIEGGGNREAQDNRLETIRLMLTMMMTKMSIRKVPHVYLPTGVCYS